jgi:hypothetical protein
MKLKQEPSTSSIKWTCDHIKSSEEIFDVLSKFKTTKKLTISRWSGTNLQNVRQRSEWSRIERFLLCREKRTNLVSLLFQHSCSRSWRSLCLWDKRFHSSRNECLSIYCLENWYVLCFKRLDCILRPFTKVQKWPGNRNWYTKLNHNDISVFDTKFTLSFNVNIEL